MTERMPTDDNISIEVTIEDTSKVSERVAAALTELAAAVVGDELVAEASGAEDEVSGFSFSKGPPLISPGGSGPFVPMGPGSMGFCIVRSSGGSNKGDDCGSYCGVNTDEGAGKCSLNWT